MIFVKITFFITMSIFFYGLVHHSLAFRRALKNKVHHYKRTMLYDTYNNEIIERLVPVYRDPITGNEYLDS